jgi:hypothetical protein
MISNYLEGYAWMEDVQHLGTALNLRNLNIYIYIFNIINLKTGRKEGLYIKARLMGDGEYGYVQKR